MAPGIQDGKGRMVAKECYPPPYDCGKIDISSPTKPSLIPWQIKEKLRKCLNKVLNTEIDWSQNQQLNLLDAGFDSSSLASALSQLAVDTGININKELYAIDLPCDITYGYIEKLILMLQEKFPCGQLMSSSKAYKNLKEIIASKRFKLHQNQQHIWELSMKNPESPMYNVGSAYTIQGDFSPDHFLKAFYLTLVEHDISFVQIIQEKNTLYQILDLELNIWPKEYDLRIEKDPHQMALKKYEEEYAKPFLFERGNPIHRASIYRTGEKHWLFTFIIHQIVFDEWSRHILFNQLWKKYKLLQEGSIKAEFCEPQIDLLKRPTYAGIANSVHDCEDEDFQFWRKTLKDFPCSNTIPGDKEASSLLQQNGKRIIKIFNVILTDNLFSFASSRDATPFEILLATLKVLIHLYSNEVDICVAAPTTGRKDVATAHVVGLFTNTLMLRTDIGKAKNFGDFIDAVKNIYAEAFQHSAIALDTVVKELDVTGDEAARCGINISYTDDVFKDKTLLPQGVTVKKELVHNNTAKWDLSFEFLLDSSESIRFSLEYCSQVYSDSLAEQISTNYEALLSLLMANPDTNIKDLLKETSNLVINVRPSILKGRQRDLGQHMLSVDLFKNVQSSNASIVSLTTMESIPVSDIHQNAVKAAYFLKMKCGLPKQTRIGILIGNGPHTFTALLSCLYEGFSFVALDAKHPKWRIEELTSRSGISAIICDNDTENLANHLRWSCKGVHFILRLNTSSLLPGLSSWGDMTAVRHNVIDGGQLKNSYTNEQFSAIELDEYCQNVLTKLQPYLQKTSCSILQIGSCVDAVTTSLASFTSKYHVTSASWEELEELKLRLLADNIDFHHCEATSVQQIFHAQKFDIIVLNSAVHAFPNHNYFCSVIDQCAGLLTPGGVIFIGDVLATERRETLIKSTINFQKLNPNAKTKTNWEDDLFLSREFLQAVCNDSSHLISVHISSKLHTLKNEFTEFRFDALFLQGTKELSQRKGNPSSKAFTLYDVNDFCSTTSFEELVNEVIQDGQMVGPYDEAYVLFTSGTSGPPKGVCISHVALKNYCTWAVEAFRLSNESHVPFFSPLTFDFTISSLFPSLLAESTIYTLPNFENFQDELRHFPLFTFMKLTPLQLEILIGMESTKPFMPRTLVLGGENVKPQLLIKLKQLKRKQKFEVWNEYGPTEATVGCIASCIHSDDIFNEMKHVPIGRPIQNVTIIIASKDMRVKSQGLPGTICILGPCVFSDYVGNDDAWGRLASAPWEWVGEHMLFTFDAGQIRRDGEVLCFGRTDDPCMVNKVRINKVKIIQHIANFINMKHCWILSVPVKGDEVLGAVIIPQQPTKNQETLQKSLKCYLRKHLPEILVPKIFTFIKQPLLNANGKADKAKLRDALQDALQDNQDALQDAVLKANIDTAKGDCNDNQV